MSKIILDSKNVDDPTSFERFLTDLTATTHGATLTNTNRQTVSATLTRVRYTITIDGTTDDLDTARTMSDKIDDAACGYGAAR